MKRRGYLYEKICDLDNIKHAILRASLGKRDHTKVRRVLQDIDSYAAEIRISLLE